MVPQLAKRRQERGKRRMEEVVDAAAQLFAEVGFESATTNAIAARAGMSPGSLYQFFPNKEAIAEALADRYVADLEATHDIAFDTDVAGLPLDELLDRMLDPLIAFHIDNPAAANLLHGAEVSSRLALATDRLQKVTLERLETIIGARSPGLSKQELGRTARVSVQIFKAMHPLIQQATETERAALVGELKAALRGYLEPLETRTSR
jgi:AcrR family transcriptional regulator